MTCKWDRETEGYLADGEPCKRDEYGDPTHHCTARRTCSAHVGKGELTCPRCIGRVRADIKWIGDLAALLPTAAIADGVDSEAANLAGPAADPGAWSARRIAMRGHLAAWARAGAITEQAHLHARAAMDDDDEHHPRSVLGRWALMLAEDYGHDLPGVLTASASVEYLGKQLGRIAQDDDRDFPLLAREIRRCRQHLESVLHNDTRSEKGAPCPTCADDEHFVRLVRTYGHWCDDDACERIHYATDEGDAWVCPRDRAHSWSELDYRSWIEDRATA